MKYSLIAACLITLATVASTQTVAVRTSVDRSRAEIGEPVVLTIELRGTDAARVPRPAPKFDGFTLGSLTDNAQLTDSDGESVVVRVIRYTLQPTRVGRFALGAVEVQTSSGLVRAAPQTVEVFSSATANSATTPPSVTSSDGFDVRVMAELSAHTVYVGERVVLTYRILSRNFLSDIEVRDQPQYANFWVKELREPAQGRRAGLVDNGLYDVAAKRVLLYPTIPGRLQIAPLTLAFRAYLQSSLGGIAPTPRTILRASQPLTLEVLPLPPPPINGPRFTGAVGQFSLAASLQQA